MPGRSGRVKVMKGGMLGSSLCFIAKKDGLSRRSRRVQGSFGHVRPSALS